VLRAGRGRAVGVLVGQGLDPQRPPCAGLPLPVVAVGGEQGEPLAQGVERGTLVDEPEVRRAASWVRGGGIVGASVGWPGRGVVVGEDRVGVVGDAEHQTELGEVAVRPGHFERGRRCFTGFEPFAAPILYLQRELGVGTAWRRVRWAIGCRSGS
jgi:hypothetical protein